MCTNLAEYIHVATSHIVPFIYKIYIVSACFQYFQESVQLLRNYKILTCCSFKIHQRTNTANKYIIINNKINYQ